MIPQRYKKPLIIAAATTVVYALLGFFLAPWLIKNTSLLSADQRTTDSAPFLDINHFPSSTLGKGRA